MPPKVFIDIAHRSFEETLARCAEIVGADLIFTSPPYPTEKPGAKGREGAPTRDYGGDAPKHFLWPDYQRLGDCCLQALKPGGFCIVIVDGPVRTARKQVGSERSLIAFDLACDWARRVGFRYVEHEAYLRDGMPGDYFPRRRSGWEPMHVLQRPGGRGYFDNKAGAQPAVTAGRVDSKPMGRMWSGRVYSGRRDVDLYKQGCSRTLTTAISARLGGQGIIDRAAIGHPAPFSQHIAEVQVTAYSPLNGLVCDPFNGSGTTGIAATRHGRSFIGGDLGAREKDGRRWADIGRERAEEAAKDAVQSGSSATSAIAVPRIGDMQGSLFK